MLDTGHVLEFHTKNPSTECEDEGEQAGVIIEDFEAWYKHEISVKKGHKVQV